MTTSHPRRQSGGTSYEEVQVSPEFGELRRKFRNFAFPVTALFLVWYFAYVLLAAFAPGFMSSKVAGNINIGLILGLLQFASTFGITMWYARWADRVFDPAADSLRHHMEGGAR